MKYVLIIGTITILVLICESLKCRSDNDGRTIEEYEDIVRSCLNSEENRNNNNNNNRNNNWGNIGNRKTQNGRGHEEDEDDDYDSGSKKEQNQKRGHTNSDRGKKKSQKEDSEEDEDYDYSWQSSSKTKRPNTNESKDRTYFPQRGKDEKNHQNHNNNHNNNNHNNNQWGQRHDSSGYNTGSSQNNYFSNGNYNNTNKKSPSPLENIDACIIHCMFRQMKMVNENSMLDQSNIINTLTRKIRDPELKEFIKDSVHECYDNLDRDNDPCDTTKSFAVCLEEKGRTNCEDWDLNKNQGNRNTWDNPYFQSSRG